MKKIGAHEYLSAREVGLLLGVSARTVQKWSLPEGKRPQCSPDLQPFRGPNGRFLYRRDIIEAIQQNCFGKRWESSPQQPEAEGLVATHS